MNTSKTENTIFIKLSGFLKNVYEPLLHIAFSLFWFLSLSGLLLMVSKAREPFIIDFRFIVGTATLFLVLFFLRVVDEIKDFEYDKLYNPDRPLITKLVSFHDLNIFLSGSAIVAIALNIFFTSWMLALIVAIDLLYGFFLIWIEKKSPAIANGMFLNLYVTYPVNIALSIYILIFCHQFYAVELSLKTIIAVIVFIAAFLHYEIGRKTCWPEKVKKDKRHYSTEIGGKNSAFLAAGMAIFSTSGIFILVAPWHHPGITTVTGALIWLSIVPVFLGTCIFFNSKNKNTGKDAPMTAFAMVFLSIFYVVIIINTITLCGITISKVIIGITISALLARFIINR